MKKLTLLFAATLLLLLTSTSWALTSSLGVGRTATTSQISCLITTTVIDAADSDRWMAYFESRDASNTVYICYAATCTTALAAFELAAASTGSRASFSIPNEYVGAMSCISVGGTVTLQFTEIKQ